MSQTFFRLTHHDWVECFTKLSRAEIGVLFYLRTLNPFGDRRLKINCQAIGEVLDIHRTSVSRALKKLEREDLIELEITTAQVKLKSNDNDTKQNSENDANPPLDRDLSHSVHPRTGCAPTHGIVHPRTECASTHDDRAPTHGTVHPRTIGIPESPPDKAFETPQTLQTYTDFKKTLSESERENFLKFVEEKTKNLEKPINDKEAWLASKNAAKQNRWEVYYERFKIEGTDNLALQEKLAAKQRAIANFQNRHNLQAADGGQHGHPTSRPSGSTLVTQPQIPCPTECIQADVPRKNEEIEANKLENQENREEIQNQATREGRANAGFTNRNNLKNAEIESKNSFDEQNDAEIQENKKLEARKRAIAEFQKRINRDLPVDEPDENTNSEEYRRQRAEFNEKSRNNNKNPDSASLTPAQKKRAIAEFQKRINRDLPVDEPDENTNSEEYRRSLAAFDELLSSSLGEKEESLAQLRRKAIASAKRQRQELARQRREAAARYSSQQEPDLQKRKERMLREIEEFNLSQQRKNTEI